MYLNLTINHEENDMCSPARCARCGKTTWSGCGMHVDAVMARVDPMQQCTCNPMKEQPALRFPWGDRGGLQ